MSRLGDGLTSVSDSALIVTRRLAMALVVVFVVAAVFTGVWPWTVAAFAALVVAACADGCRIARQRARGRHR